MSTKRKNDEDDERRSTRSRNLSDKVSKVVDDDTRRAVVQSRLDALENDSALQAADMAEESDDEFILEGSDQELDASLAAQVGPASSRKGKGKGRKKRGADSRSAGVKPFLTMLMEDAYQQALDREHPYELAAAAPSKISAPRKLCSVCGSSSAYMCTRCGSRYCTRRCYTVHTETRCLKFVA